MLRIGHELVTLPSQRRRLIVKALAAALASVLVLMALAWALSAGFLRFNYPSRDEFPVWGIDVSHHQGPIDWDAVRAGGEVAFAYIKATEGGDWTDRRFAENWAAARARGLRVGAYHFFTLCRDAEAQADNFIRTVPQADALPHVVDLEFGGNCGARPDPPALRRSVEVWLDRVEAHYGRRPLLYVTHEFFDAYLEDAAPLGELWIRDIFWRPHLPHPWRYPLWQFANRGRLGGIEGPVDLNVFWGDAAAWERFARVGVTGAEP